MTPSAYKLWRESHEGCLGHRVHTAGGWGWGGGGGGVGGGGGGGGVVGGVGGGGGGGGRVGWGGGGWGGWGGGGWGAGGGGGVGVPPSSEESRGWAALYRDCIGGFGPERAMSEQFPGRQGSGEISRAVERPLKRIPPVVRRREGSAFRRPGDQITVRHNRLTARKPSDPETAAINGPLGEAALAHQILGRPSTPIVFVLVGGISG